MYSNCNQFNQSGQGSSYSYNPVHNQSNPFQQPAQQSTQSHQSQQPNPFQQSQPNFNQYSPVIQQHTHSYQPYQPNQSLYSQYSTQSQFNQIPQLNHSYRPNPLVQQSYQPTQSYIPRRDRDRLQQQQARELLQQERLRAQRQLHETKKLPDQWGVDDDYNLAYIMMSAFYHGRVNGDNYVIGGSNPLYEQRSERIKSTKSVVPSQLPPVQFKRGWVDDYVEFNEMLDYYQQCQNNLIRKNDVRGLQQLELSFCRTYEARPQPEDYNSEVEYTNGARRWIEGERSRILDGFSPYCLPAAKRLIGRIEPNKQWADSHTAIVDKYEKEVNDYNDPMKKVNHLIH